MVTESYDEKNGPKRRVSVIWAISEFFLYFFHISLILTNLFSATSLLEV
jgi:hypothetical protein